MNRDLVHLDRVAGPGERIPLSRFRLGVTLWAAGMLGVVVMTLTVLPPLIEQLKLPVQLWVVMLASMAQSAVLLTLAIWAGTALSSAVGLRAPAFEAAVRGESVVRALRPQLLPGLLAGVAGGGLLLLLERYSPHMLVSVRDPFNVPIAARVLYGGLTEELLMRWGLMTALLWLAWRFFQNRAGAPRVVWIVFAIGTSALIFGLGHLPAATALIGQLTRDVALFLVGANLLFGLLFGALFWRFGLEAAMLAHGTAHAVAYLIGVARSLV